MNQIRRLGHMGVILILCSCVVVPGFTLGNWPQIRAELFFAVVFASVYLWFLLAGWAQPVKLWALVLIAVVFSCTTMVSMWYGTRVLHHELLYRDYFEIPKAWLPVLFYYVACEAEFSEGALRKLLNWVACVTVVVCLYAWAQYLRLEFTYWLNPLYSSAEHNDTALLLYSRVYSTLGNPNVLGQFLSWMLIVYTVALLYQKSERARNLSLILICVATLVISGSRYGLLASGFGLALICVLALQESGGIRKVAPLILVVSAMAGVFFFVQARSASSAARFEQLREPSKIDSVRERLDNLWTEAGEFIASSPWVGHGPAKQIFTEAYTDSEYLDVLKQYGVVGFIPYIASYLWVLWVLWKGLRASRRLSTNVAKQFATNLLILRMGMVILCMALFMNIGEFTFYNWELVGTLWLWMGLAGRSSSLLQSVAEGASGVVWIKQSLRSPVAQSA